MGREVSKGDIGSLVLAVLAGGPCHGYAIAREVERQSREVLQMREGSLYPALRVLEAQGLIKGSWETGSSGPARKVYSLTTQGHDALVQKRHAWAEYARAINEFLGGTYEQSA
ncbi:MAG: helix-turn-helix transcriptional regulator [Abitibacteriaceae bacterium]|nr:helix-turn-helix transcriptional regulator [Abditibacteriaceae bacterium]